MIPPRSGWDELTPSDQVLSKTVPREADNVTMIADDVYIFPSKYGLTSHPVLLSFEGPSDMNEDSNSMNFVSVDLDSSSGQNDSYTDVEQHSEMEHTKEGEDSTPRESHAEEERAGGSKELLLNGFATWGPLQLEREIHEGGWFLTPFLANASIVFDTPREVWSCEESVCDGSRQDRRCTTGSWQSRPRGCSPGATSSTGCSATDRPARRV
eukprot:748632-Hanusia_phi.AAC.4